MIENNYGAMPVEDKFSLVYLNPKEINVTQMETEYKFDACAFC